MRLIEESIVPRPRHATASGDSLDLRNLEAIEHPEEPAATAGAERISHLLAEELDLDVPTVTKPTDANILRIRTGRIDGSESEDAYTLSIAASGITIEAASAVGIHYAGQTLLQLVSAEAGTLTVPTGEIRDWPASEWRGFMADPARGFIPLDHLKTIVDRLAKAKLNVLHLHLVDSQSWRLELESYPDLAGGITPQYSGSYSREEMEALVAYAAERDVTVVPEIDVPGHGLALLSHVPELRCDTGEDVRSFGKKAAICIGQERTYEFLEQVFAEIVEIFPSEVIHVGADEWVHNGVNWEHCECCQSRIAEQGYDGVRELFYEFLRRVHDILAEHDRRMMVWNDQIDISESPDLPMDILIHFWLVSYGDWGPPQDGNSLQRFLEEGFEVVNSVNSVTYANLLDRDQLLDWDPHQLPVVDPEYESGVVGSELPAWHGWRTDGWKRYYRRSLPSMIPVYGDRVWNGSAIDDSTEFTRAITTHVLGPNAPTDFDLFDVLGGVILPTGDAEDTDWADVSALLRDRSIPDAIQRCHDARETLALLESSKPSPDPDLVREYDAVLAWLSEVLDRERRGVPLRPDWPIEQE